MSWKVVRKNQKNSILANATLGNIDVQKLGKKALRGKIKVDLKDFHYILDIKVWTTGWIRGNICLDIFWYEMVTVPFLHETPYAGFSALQCLRTPLLVKSTPLQLHPSLNCHNFCTNNAFFKLTITKIFYGSNNLPTLKNCVRTV